MRTKDERRRAQRQKNARLRNAGTNTIPNVSLSDNPGSSAARTGSLTRGIFYPELVLGAGSLSYNRRLELQQFLVDVVRQRGYPLHLANLWNSLYFHYDLDARGFRPELLNPERIPTRDAARRAPSVPVGGFVRVHTEMACGDLLGEVVYKEGAHPSVDVGSLTRHFQARPPTTQTALPSSANGSCSTWRRSVQMATRSPRNSTRGSAVSRGGSIHTDTS